MNINARFPEGAAFEGANTALMGVLLEEGLGIIQMPCPEYLCLGLEKYDYGKIIGEELSICFRKSAETVVSQVKDHLSLGFEVVGIMGMDPSPSCGVETTKGRGTMEGTDTDTSEKPDSRIGSRELIFALRGPVDRSQSIIRWKQWFFGPPQTRKRASCRTRSLSRQRAATTRSLQTRRPF